MVWRAMCAAIAVTVVGSVAFASTTDIAKGRITAVSLNSVTVAADDGQAWVFEAAPGTQVIAEGASHKSGELRRAGKKTALAEFVQKDQHVSVKYREENGRLKIEELRVY